MELDTNTEPVFYLKKLGGGYSGDKSMLHKFHVNKM